MKSACKTPQENCKERLITKSNESATPSNHSQQKYAIEDRIPGYLDIDVSRAAANNDKAVYDRKQLGVVRKK